MKIKICNLEVTVISGFNKTVNQLNMHSELDLPHFIGVVEYKMEIF